MKQGRKAIVALILAGSILSSGLSAWGEQVVSPLFTLDTRGSNWTYSGLFTLDTRDLDVGTTSALFTLDTRGGLEPQTSLFTLDTRGLELSYAPQNLQVTAEQLTVAHVSWEYFGTPLGFQLQRRDPLGEWTSMSVSGGSARSLKDTTVWPAHFYEYRVAAVLSAGVSAYSDIAYIQMPSMPNAPGNLGAVYTEADQIQLSWMDLSHNEEGFEIWRKVGAEGEWNSIGIDEVNSTGHVDSAVSPVTLYTYKLRAFNEWGNSAFSEEAAVMTPDSGTGCGWELLINDAALTLDGTVVVLDSQALADSRALLEGVVWAFIKSPRGNPHPSRVVLGYRDETGQAVGSPVEWIDFYTVPGCPGISVKAEIPAAFRAPEDGTNTLWAEMIMAQRDPVEAFMTQRHTQESPMRKRLLDVAIRTEAVPEIRVRLLDEATTPGAVVEVPIQLISDGGETLISFSIAMGEGLHCLDVLPTSDAPHAMVDTSVSSNVLGITVFAPLENPLGAGTKHLLTIPVWAETPGEYDLSFTDDPVARAVMAGPTNLELVTWEDSVVTVAVSGWEGDVSPQPSGDGVLDKQDVRLARQFVVGCQPLPDDPWEFQRLDCAPVATCGDGQIDMADVVAIKQMVKDGVALTPACGPTNLVETAPSAVPLLKTSSLRNLLLSAPEEVCRGDSFWASIEVTSQGDEHGMSLSVSFDSDVLAYQDLRLQGPPTNGVFLPNMEELADGVIAISLTLADDVTFTAGTQLVVEVNFMALEGAGTAVTSLEFVPSPAECKLVGLDSGILDSDTIDTDVIVAEMVSSGAPLPPESGEALALATDQIKVSWESVSSATGYRVRHKIEGEALWTIVEECEATRSVIVDDGLPSGTVCDYLVTSLNPLGVESAVLRLQATTWTELEAWRDVYFKQIENTDSAADTADPDGDAIPNLLEYQLGTDPLSVNDLPYSMGVEEVFTGLDSLTISYAVANGAPGALSFEFTGNLLDPDLWSNQGISPISLRTVGASELIKLRLPEDILTNRMLFLRMKAD
jgi:hypothetical protein